MLTDYVIDLRHVHLPKFVVVDDASVYHLPQHSIQGSALLAHKREVKVHGIVTIGLDDREHGLALLVHDYLCFTPVAKGSVLVFQSDTYIIYVFHLADNVVSLFLSQSSFAHLVHYIGLQDLSSLLLIGADAEQCLLTFILRQTRNLLICHLHITFCTFFGNFFLIRLLG